MTDLTEQWKDGELNALDELIYEIEEVDNRKALSDEYLKENYESTREEYSAVEEYGYGITFVMTDYVLPYLKKMQLLKEGNKSSKKELSEHKEVCCCFENEVLRLENAKLKELLKECRNCVTRQIYGSPTRQYFEGVFDNELLIKIDNAIGEKK